MSFLEIYVKLMNFFIVLPFILKYLANAEYMINCRPVESKATLMIPDNFFAYGVNLESKILDKIL